MAYWLNRATLVMIALLLMGGITDVIANDRLILSRQLKASCHNDKCGIFCGPERPPPCGNAPRPDWEHSRSDSFSPDDDGYVRPGPGRVPEEYPPLRPSNPINTSPDEYLPLRPSSQDGPITARGPDYEQPADHRPPVPPRRSNNHPAPESQEAKGCFGEIPFGLENCVCQGADIGHAAGTAACGRVFTECDGLVPFGHQGEPGALAAIQRVCDTFALDSCVAAASFVVSELPGCEDLLQFGTPKCTPREAMAIFKDNVNHMCDPICTDCVRHDELPPFKPSPVQYSGDVSESDSSSSQSPWLNQHPEDPLPTRQPHFDPVPQSQERVPAQHSPFHPTADDKPEQARRVDQLTPRTIAQPLPQTVSDRSKYEQPPDRRGCFGSLPFGLENCVCDGAEIGEMAGLAACGRLFAECEGLAPFQAADGTIEAAQRICDTFALDGCISAAQGVVVNNVGCAEILKNGTPKCSRAEAWAVFTRSVNRQCEPLCRDCTRHPELP